MTVVQGVMVCVSVLEVGESEMCVLAGQHVMLEHMQCSLWQNAVD